MRHDRTPALNQNLIDADGRVILAVPARAAVLLLPLLLEHKDFLRAVRFQNRCGDFRAPERRADTHVAAVLDHDHVAQLDFRARLTGDILQPDSLPRRHPILFAARPNYGVHGWILLRTEKP